jgi:5-methylcytosine-specific restriction endonuclease McrA
MKKKYGTSPEWQAYQKLQGQKATERRRAARLAHPTPRSLAVLARKAAIAAADRTYQGQPCPQGHTERYTKTRCCVECQRAYRLEHAGELVEYNRKRYRAHEAEVRAQAKAWNAANPERAARSRREWRAKNLEKARGDNKAWREANRERKNETARRWIASNPEIGKRKWQREKERNHEKIKLRLRAKEAKRRGQKLASGEHHTAQDLIELFIEQKGLCAYCEADLIEAGQHTDHIQPLARGGSNGRANLCLACRVCNVRKGALTGEEFRERLRSEAGSKRRR